jgi:SET and MYND domain-containing protein
MKRSGSVNEALVAMAGGEAAGLPPLPEGVLLQADGRRGRHLVASRPYKRGELVLAQAPYRAVLDEQHTATHCDHTFVPASSGQQLLRCSRSKLARYVSRAAQKAAWRDGYKEECEALVRCAPRVPPPTVRLAARCLWRMQRDRDNPAQAAGGWESYEALCSLQHHWDELPSSRKQLYAQMAVLVRQFMCGTPTETAHFRDDTTPDKLWAPPQGTESEAQHRPDTMNEADGLPSTRSIALLLARFAANAHTIADEELSPIGVGIFPLASMVNHSCACFNCRLLSIGSCLCPFWPECRIELGYRELQP